MFYPLGKKLDFLDLATCQKREKLDFLDLATCQKKREASDLKKEVVLAPVLAPVDLADLCGRFGTNVETGLTFFMKKGGKTSQTYCPASLYLHNVLPSR